MYTRYVTAFKPTGWANENDNNRRTRAVAKELLIPLTPGYDLKIKVGKVVKITDGMGSEKMAYYNIRAQYTQHTHLRKNQGAKEKWTKRNN